MSIALNEKINNRSIVQLSERFEAFGLTAIQLSEQIHNTATEKVCVRLWDEIEWGEPKSLTRVPSRYHKDEQLWTIDINVSNESTSFKHKKLFTYVETIWIDTAFLRFPENEFRETNNDAKLIETPAIHFVYNVIGVRKLWKCNLNTNGGNFQSNPFTYWFFFLILIPFNEILQRCVMSAMPFVVGNFLAFFLSFFPSN